MRYCFLCLLFMFLVVLQPLDALKWTSKLVTKNKKSMAMNWEAREWGKGTRWGSTSTSSLLVTNGEWLGSEPTIFMYLQFQRHVVFDINRRALAWDPVRHEVLYLFQSYFILFCLPWSSWYCWVLSSWRHTLPLFHSFWMLLAWLYATFVAINVCLTRD